MAGAIGGFVGGLVATGTLKGAAFGALSGAVAAGIGQSFKGAWAGKYGENFREVARAMAHGVSQGAIADVQGGRFSSGFYAGAFSSLAASYGPMNGSEHFTPKLIQATVAGGTGSVIGGDKFENGAVTGAFVFLFNDCFESDGKGGSAHEGNLPDETRSLTNKERESIQWVIDETRSRGHQNLADLLELKLADGKFVANTTMTIDEFAKVDPTNSSWIVLNPDKIGEYQLFGFTVVEEFVHSEQFLSRP